LKKKDKKGQKKFYYKIKKIKFTINSVLKNKIKLNFVLKDKIRKDKNKL
jgi:hypothetical protein